jgi:hypothetical protein
MQQSKWFLTFCFPAILVLSACRGIGGAPGGFGGNVKSAQNYTECAPGIDCANAYDDQTDNSSCGAKAAVTQPTLARTWVHKRHYKAALRSVAQMTSASSQLPASARDEQTTYYIDADKTHMMVTTSCTSEYKSINAVAIADISTTPNLLQVMAAKQNTSSATLSSGHVLRCTAKIPAGPISYAFSGSCLVLAKSTFKRTRLAPAPSTAKNFAE